MAHTNLNQLKKLLKLLDSTDSDIYIHIDRKSSIDVADLKTQYSKLYVFKEYSVYWGEYSQISVELLLLKAAVKKGNYNYIHLISGMDLPLMSIKKMNEFLERGGDRNYVHFVPEHKRDIAYDWIKYYYYFNHMEKSKFKIVRKVYPYYEKILVKIQLFLGINRLKNESFILAKGANWFSINQQLAEYIISKEKWIEKHFKHCKFADELFLQTVIWNSPYRNTLYREDWDDDYRSCLRYIDWNRGRPYIFKVSDKKELDSVDGFLFARKFDEKIDGEIIDYLVRKYI